MVSEGPLSYIEKLIQSFSPSEIIYSKGNTKEFKTAFGDKFYTFRLDEWVYSLDYAREKLTGHFEVQNLKGFGIEELKLAQIAAGAVLHYLATTENNNLKHINAIHRLQPDRYVWLDRFTIRNLELIFSAQPSGIPLISILDKTVSPMGARMLKKWVVLPLKEKVAIDARLDMVDYFIKERELNHEIEKHIRSIGDLERLISKVPLGKINPREVVQLRRALHAIEPIKVLLGSSGNSYLMKIADGLNPCKVLSTQIEKEILEEPAVNIAKGGVIADGVNEELDELRNVVKQCQGSLAGYSKKQRLKKQGLLI